MGRNKDHCTVSPRTVHRQNKTNIREGWLRGSDVNLQMSVFVAERIRMSLQLRAFNVLNHVSFGGVTGNARRVEVGAKIYF